jgi:hypothetical protein
MPRKIRTDSIATQCEMAATKPPDPPPHVFLRDGDRPFWDSIVRAREYRSWHAADLEQAAILARAKADLDRFQRKLVGQPDLVVDRYGKQSPNPLHGLIETLARRVLAYSRALQVTTTATVGEPAQTRRRNQTQRDIAAKVEADDELLARPTH